MKIKAKIKDEKRIQDYLDVFSNLKNIETFEEHYYAKGKIDFDNLRSSNIIHLIKKGKNFKVIYLHPIKKEKEGIEIAEEETFLIQNISSFTKFLKFAGFNLIISEKRKEKTYHSKKEPTLKFNLVEVEKLGKFLELSFNCQTEHDRTFASEKMKNIFKELQIKKIENGVYIQMLANLAKISDET